MKYLKQFGIILILSFAGELLKLLIPLPTAIFLIEIMPLMFIPAAVGLMESWGIIRAKIIPYLVITVLSTFLVMAAAGKITQAVIRRDRKKACHHE